MREVFIALFFIPQKNDAKIFDLAGRLWIVKKIFRSIHRHSVFFYQPAFYILPIAAANNNDTWHSDRP
jgi:hypothetical protein